jgi:hypothetical protein
MSREAMKLALEALETIAGAMPFPVGKSAITALRKALAVQPAQQEPVAIKTMSKIGKAVGYWRADLIPPHIRPDSHDITPLYTSPPAQRTWVGLTIDEVESGAGLEKAQSTEALDLSTSFWAGARWAEAKLKEKNNG